jgi:phosphonate transport system substrate-binding protein
MAPMDRRRFLLAALTAPFGAAAPASGGPGLRIGLTAVILADQAAFLARWGDYFARRVGVPVTFVARDSYQDILDLLFGSKLDAAWVCGYPYVLHEPQLRLLAVPLYQGQPTYQSYLIRAIGANPALRGWEDLKGRVLAYSDPLSNSGWLVAQGRLRAAGLRAADLKRAFFAHGHRNVAEAVAARLADAGSIDGYVWETMLRQGMPASRRTEVVWKSDAYGFPPIVSRRAGEHPKVGVLRAHLLRMHDDVEGRDLLAALNLDGFSEGDSKLFDGIRVMARQVRDEGGA